ncbi:MAG: hypothetical protein ACOH2V_11565 [Candidatus Saccharimonadaceae bacterium]
MKFSYGDDYFIRRESYVTSYKANGRLLIYTVIAIIYAIVESKIRMQHPDNDLLLYIGIAITGTLVGLLSFLFIRKLTKNDVFDIGILLVILFSIYLFVSNLITLFA